MNITAVHVLQDSSQVAPSRRAAVQLAERLGFSEARAGQAALVVSELATNLTKHAKKGELLLRPIQHGHEPNQPGGGDGIEILAIDSGPGMPDLALARQDGYSTTGTLGHGLGSIERQSDFFQIYTQPSGTVIVARLWRDRPSPAVRHSRYELGAVHVSHPGEDICGDDWTWHMRDDRLAIMVADGLGHGRSAHEAARAATSVFQRLYEESPSRVIEEVHASLRATRGAAVAMLAVDTERGVAKYCGLGNITTVAIPPTGSRHSMISQNGTAGHVAARIHEFHYPIAPQSILVMFSDGLISHWDLATYPGLRTRDPSVIAGILYRDFSRRRDDLTVIVAKSR